jgi:hypothetical protein
MFVSYTFKLLWKLRKIFYPNFSYLTEKQPPENTAAIKSSSKTFPVNSTGKKTGRLLC